MHCLLRLIALLVASAACAPAAYFDPALPFASWTWAKPPYQGTADSEFGSVVAMSSAFVAVGAPNPVLQKNHTHGAVYIFRIVPQANELDMFVFDTVLIPAAARLLPPPGEVGGPSTMMSFGSALAFTSNGRVLAVGSFTDSSCEPMVDPSNTSCASYGSVYLYMHSVEQGWVLRDVLQDPRSRGTYMPYQQFGRALVGSGDRLAIVSSDTTCVQGVLTDESSLPPRPPNGAPACWFSGGAVFVYRALNVSEPALFSFEAFMKSSIATISAQQDYGSSGLSLLGSRLLVGDRADRSCQTGILAPGTLTAGPPFCGYSGSAHSYLYSDISGKWEAEVVVKPPPGVATGADNFGLKIEQMSAEHVIISAPFDGGCFVGALTDGCSYAGSVYLYFIDSNGTWTMKQEVKAHEAANRAGVNQQFGAVLTVPSSSMLLIGATGAPYCFLNNTNNTRWCSRSTSIAAFPFFLNDTLTPRFPSGEGYRPNPTWLNSYRLVSNTDLFVFGIPDLNTCIGDPSLQDCRGSGGVLAFRTSSVQDTLEDSRRQQDTPYFQDGLLLNPDPPTPPRANWNYESMTHVAGDYVAIATQYDSGCDLGSTAQGPTRFLGCEVAGAIYVYRRINFGAALAKFVPDAYIKQDRRFGTKVLGQSLAMTPTRLVSGSVYACTIPVPDCRRFGNGVLFVFDRDESGNPGDGSAGAGAGSWSKTSEIVSQHVHSSSSNFGGSVALSRSGKVLVAGHVSDPSCATGVNPLNKNDTGCPGSGGVEVFMQLPSGTWQSTTFIKPPVARQYYHVGSSGRTAVSPDGRVIALGSPSDAACTVNDLNNNGCPQMGAVFIYRCSGACDSAASSTWSLQAVLKPPTWVATLASRFGQRIAFSGTTRISLAVTVPNDSSNASGVNGVRYNSSAGLPVFPGGVLLYYFDNTTDSWDLEYHVKADVTGNLTEAGADSIGSGLAFWEDLAPSNNSNDTVVTRLLLGSGYSWGCYNMSVVNTAGKTAPARPPPHWISCTGGVVFMYERLVSGAWRTTALANPVNDRYDLYEGYGTSMDVSGTVISILGKSDANCGTNFDDFDQFEAACIDSGAATFYGAFVPVPAPGSPTSPVGEVVASSSSGTADSTTLIVILVVSGIVLLAAVIVAFIFDRRRRASRNASGSAGEELPQHHYASFSAHDPNMTYHNVKTVTGQKQSGDSSPGTTYHNVRDVTKGKHDTDDGQQYHNVKVLDAGAPPPSALDSPEGYGPLTFA